MTAIQEIIQEHYPKIGVNTENGRIVNDGKKLLDFVYTDIIDKYKEKCGGTITKIQVKEEVQRYASGHPWTPSRSKSSQKKTEPWSSGLEFDENDLPKRTLKNAKIFLSKHPNYAGRFSFNDFTQTQNFNGRPIKDSDITHFRFDCEEVLGFNTKDLVESAVVEICTENSFHPFKDAISNLVWDGTNRVETFFIKYLGAEDTPLNRSMTKKFFYAMIRRLWEPGCDFDNMPIMADPTQGTGKTKILMRFPKALGINYGCDTSISCDPKDKDNVDKMNRCWIAIIDELGSFMKKDPEVTKQFLGQSSDVARLSYDKRSQTFERHCVFYATTNQDYFLKDYASDFERRYWVMDCHGTPHDAEWWDTNLPDSEVLQVLAEAYKFYKDNPKFKYTELTLKEKEELLQVQRRHKTMCNDDVLQDQILRVLRNNFKETSFNDQLEFANAMNLAQNAIQPQDRTIDGFLGIAGDDIQQYKQIDAIPSVWLKEWIQTYLKPRYTISTKYLAQLIGDEFEYIEKGHYKKKDGSWWSTNVFKRRTNKGDSGNDIQVD